MPKLNDQDKNTNSQNMEDVSEVKAMAEISLSPSSSSSSSSSSSTTDSRQPLTFSPLDQEVKLLLYSFHLPGLDIKENSEVLSLCQMILDGHFSSYDKNEARSFLQDSIIANDPLRFAYNFIEHIIHYEMDQLSHEQQNSIENLFYKLEVITKLPKEMTHEWREAYFITRNGISSIQEAEGNLRITREFEAARKQVDDAQKQVENLKGSLAAPKPLEAAQRQLIEAKNRLSRQTRLIERIERSIFELPRLRDYTEEQLAQMKIEPNPRVRSSSGALEYLHGLNAKLAIAKERLAAIQQKFDLAMMQKQSMHLNLGKEAQSKPTGKDDDKRANPKRTRLSKL